MGVAHCGLQSIQMTSRRSGDHALTGAIKIPRRQHRHPPSPRRRVSRDRTRPAFARATVPQRRYASPSPPSLEAKSQPATRLRIVPTSQWRPESARQAIPPLLNCKRCLSHEIASLMSDVDTSVYVLWTVSTRCLFDRPQLRPVSDRRFR